MSEELNQQEQVAEAAAEPAAEPTPKKAAKAKKDDGYPKFMRAGKGFSYTDPETNIRYSPVVPVKVDVAPKEGSWLASQIAAGYIVEA